MVAPLQITETCACVNEVCVQLIFSRVSGCRNATKLGKFWPFTKVTRAQYLRRVQVLFTKTDSALLVIKGSTSVTD